MPATGDWNEFNFGYLDSQSKSEHGRALRLRRFPKIADICSVDLFIGYCHGLPAYTVLRPAVWILKPLRLVPLHCEHLWHFVTLGASWRGRNFQGSTGLQCCHWHLSQWPRVPWMQRVCKKASAFHLWKASISSAFCETVCGVWLRWFVEAWCAPAT